MQYCAVPLDAAPTQRTDFRMTLVSDLKAAKTEEDVKDAYVRAIGLKNYSKNLVDIQTKEVWFEAKEAGTSPVAMFAQLLVYVKVRDKNEHLPPFLAVIDRDKAAIMETEKATALLQDKTVIWPKSGSKVSKEFVSQVSAHVAAHYVVYNIDSHEKEFIHAMKSAVKYGKINRIQITPDNLRQVFDKWVEYIGSELGGVAEADYALLFFADIMHDGKRAAMANLSARLLFDGEKPVFVLNGQQYDLVSDRGYRNFWAIYHRPPDEEYRNYLLERRDSLLPLDERSFKGAFFTPLKVVDKAYDLLTEVLGRNWQQNYIVWDMCCGVGNLEVKHSNHRNIFMSTLDKADIDVMQASHTCVAATKFQYDYLNDDIDAFGQIDYSLTNKVPKALRAAIANAQGARSKKILVLMNPPYAEATNDNTARGVAEDESGSKTDVANTKFSSIVSEMYGKASNDLFTQFIARTHIEIPGATLAMFSTLKYVISPTLEKFRSKWTAEFLGGLVIHSRVFDGVDGNFPIGFLVWDTAKNESISRIETQVLDKDCTVLGRKVFQSSSNSSLLTDWIERPRSNASEVIPLKNSITAATATKDLRGTRWSENAIAYLWCNSNDLQQANKTALFSSGFNGGHGLYVNPDNLWQAAIVFAVRRLVAPVILPQTNGF